MARPDPTVKYHLANDASKRRTGGEVFQLRGVAAGVETTNSKAHQASERIIMFINLKLTDPESRYTNSERDVLAVFRNLAEVR